MVFSELVIALADRDVEGWGDGGEGVGGDGVKWDLRFWLEEGMSTGGLGDWLKVVGLLIGGVAGT